MGQTDGWTTSRYIDPTPHTMRAASIIIILGQTVGDGRTDGRPTVTQTLLLRIIIDAARIVREAGSICNGWASVRLSVVPSIVSSDGGRQVCC